MISHYHKTIFVHIPKCGGQSIENIFLSELGLSWKNRAPLLLRPKTPGEHAPKKLAHLKLHEYIDNSYISRDLFDEYFKFSVVRNPYSRVKSLFEYLGFSNRMRLNDFVADVLPGKCRQADKWFWFFMPQVNFIIDSNSDIGVDEILYLEKIDDDWLKVLRNTNVETAVVPKKNVTKSGKKSVDEFDATSLEIINSLYKLDFDVLGYSSL